uniref:Major facilitator superfamily (MFS) profile domain-containing protein n=1 Tax=Panagrolaimus sp. JU765 TaxID=591449 RepID=A0AC34QN32_9BILA
MGERERVYLQSFPELQSSGKNRRFGIPPFKSLLTSPAFLSLLLCSMATNMVASILQIYLPTFLKEVLFLSSVDNGLFSAAPPLIQFLSKMMWSVSIDHFKTRGLSPTVAVKLSQGITNFGSAVLLVAIGYYADCTQPYIALALFCLLGICFSTATSGFFTSMVSLAPSYTGIITSISFVFGVTGRSLPSIVVPYFNKTGSLEEWRNVFFVTSTLLVVSGIIFVLFGSGHPQKWGFEPEQKKSVQEQKIDLSNLVAANEMGSMMLETVDA